MLRRGPGILEVLVRVSGFGVFKGVRSRAVSFRAFAKNLTPFLVRLNVPVMH